VDAAKARIESLNPLVAVETMTSPSALELEEFDALVQTVDLVCITESERDFLVGGWCPNSSDYNIHEVPAHRFAQMMRAEGRESRFTRAGRMASSVISSVICWSTNTSPRTCLMLWDFRDERLLKAAPLSRDPIFGYSDRSGGQDMGRDVRVTVSYSPLREALRHRWSGMTRRQTKSLNPAAVFIILGVDNEHIFCPVIMC